MHVDQPDHGTRLDGARVPVVLPLVEVTIDSGGVAAVAVDGDHRASHGPIERGAIGRLLDEIAAQLGPIRVHVTEGDGSEFTDVVVPRAAVTDEPPSIQNSPAPGIAGTGFLPDEDVEVAIVVARQKAEADGTARLRVPPALAGRAGVVVLFGRTSGAFLICEPG